MNDEWMPGLKLAMSIEQFQQLPRNAAYRYEYLDGTAWLSPRPKHFHAQLDLAAPCAKAETAVKVKLRQLRQTDWHLLEGVFAAAFQRIQPFAGLEDATLAKAAHQCLGKTRAGGDGPLISSACVVACGTPSPGMSLRGPGILGAILITLLPSGDPEEYDSYYWREPPPADCITDRQGRPHLTWVFVDPSFAGAGVGSALLAAAGKRLLRLGFAR